MARANQHMDFLIKFYTFFNETKVWTKLRMFAGHKWSADQSLGNTAFKPIVSTLTEQEKHTVQLGQNMYRFVDINEI